MSKDMEDRNAKIAPIYAGIAARNPVLRSSPGDFKGDLSGLCSQYDSNFKEYDALMKRKTDLSKYIDQLNAAYKAYAAAVEANKGERDKVHAENKSTQQQYGNDLGNLVRQGKKTDVNGVTILLKEYADATKKLLERDKVYSDKREDLNAKFIGDQQKFSDSYGKEAKEILAALNKLAKDEDALEAEIRLTVLKYQQTAVRLHHPELEKDLKKISAAFP